MQDLALLTNPSAGCVNVAAFFPPDAPSGRAHFSCLVPFPPFGSSFPLLGNVPSSFSAAWGVHTCERRHGTPSDTLVVSLGVVLCGRSSVTSFGTWEAGRRAPPVCYTGGHPTQSMIQS
jgi:hypothetical protein